MSSWKSHFSRFFDANEGTLHFAAHSHHYWPDVTFEAQRDVWRDAAAHVDSKWDKVFSEVLPQSQELVARAIGGSDPRSIAFAVNTHELLLRLVSCIERSPVRILTSDAEFHSFSRQAQRWQEAGVAKMEIVPAEPFDTFEERFLERASGDHDLVYVSHVAFNSGFVFERLEELAASAPKEALLVLDGYHSFMALPFDWSAVEDRAFYLSGGYKYAMAGEGCCFLVCPPGIAERPVNTGWYSVFGDLQKPKEPGTVPYAADGMRFFGSTFDPSGLYRLRAALSLWQREGVTAEAIHRHVVELQSRFLEAVASGTAGPLQTDDLLPPVSDRRRGHFLTFQRPDAPALHEGLKAAGVVTDVRGDRLRFGFGVYQDSDDVEQLCARLSAVG